MVPEMARVTTRYDRVQDRFSLAGELPQGLPVVLWLTQRLLLRLLPPLLAWLQEHDAPPQHQPLQHLYAETLQGFAQQAACAGLEPQAPVAVQAVSPEWLVESIDLAHGPAGVRLVFLGRQGPVAAMAMPAQALRQWLGIVCHAWRQAPWPMEPWPAWLVEAGGGAGAPQAGAVH